MLASGKVLIAGGFDDFFLTASAELYDPGTGVWQSAVSGRRSSESGGRWLAGASLLMAAEPTSVPATAEYELGTFKGGPARPAEVGGTLNAP